MEDELMRRFGGDRISNLMSKLGVEDDMPIEAGVVSKAIENAQSKVEGYNFDIRKHVLRYDEVVNEQRNRIYEQRRRILTEASLKTSVQDMIEDEVAAIVEQFTTSEYEDEWGLEELAHALGAVFPLPADFSIQQWEGLSDDAIEEQAIDMALRAYADKEREVGEEYMRLSEKQIMLWAVDNRWVRHLTDLDRLREGIGLQGVGGLDPLVAYKREAFQMYSELMDSIRSDIVKAIYAVKARETQPVMVTPIARNIHTNRGGNGGNGSTKQKTVRKTGPNLKRNDLCWCGSGKKYKHCHMKSDRAKASGREQVKA
jgi:preprotein translocase subunit SecA